MCLGREDCVCAEAEQEFVVGDTELNEMLAVVAEQAYQVVVEAYYDALNEQRNQDVLDEDFNLYLYVYDDGAWVIDAPDFLQDHRNLVSCALVGPYTSVDTLRYELEGGTF